MCGFKNCLPVNDHLVSFDGDHLTGIFIHKVFYPALQNPGCQCTAHQFLQSGFAYLHFVGKTKDLQHIFITFIAYGPKQCGDG